MGRYDTECDVCGVPAGEPCQPNCYADVSPQEREAFRAGIIGLGLSIRRFSRRAEVEGLVDEIGASVDPTCCTRCRAVYRLAALAMEVES